ncbi:heme o synthase [Corynebacterium otitidis]|uniref:heme o synthase n=1 Tax=Corynebacterium otitidis TaxID=29321 RepID=UPI003BAA027F
MCRRDDGGGSLLDVIKAYIALTKPRVIELLLIAAVPAMLQANRGSIDLLLIVLTLVGGWMGAAAANTFNMVADYDIDQKMQRTRARPLVRHTVSKRSAFIFAWTLTVVSFLWLWLLCGSLLAGVFVLITIAFYIFVYTKVLKRRTPMNIVWGGAAGCMPAFVGWAAIAANDPDSSPWAWWQAVVMWLIVFFWTPPHTWSLAMKYRADYERAGVPMLPVVAKPVEVTRQIIAYSWATVIVSLLLLPAASWLYAIAAIACGAVFLVMATRLHNKVRDGEKVKPLRLFILSNNYLALLFMALSIDAALGLETIGVALGWSPALFG